MRALTIILFSLVILTSSSAQSIAENCYRAEFLTEENSAEVIQLKIFSQANGTFYGILLNELLDMDGKLLERYDFEITGNFIYGEHPSYRIKKINDIEVNTTINTSEEGLTFEGEELPTIIIEQKDYFQKPKNWISCN